MLNEYVELRRSLASRNVASSSDANAASTETPADADEKAPASGPTVVLPTRTNSSAPMPVPIERTRKPKTSREYLSHIAWLSEEVLRASQEKVNLAQATYDSVRPVPHFQHPSP